MFVWSQQNTQSAGALGAVFRTVLETTRTLFVWLVDLLLWYTPLGFGTLGESWSKYSWIQALGYANLHVCLTMERMTTSV